MRSGCRDIFLKQWLVQLINDMSGILNDTFS